MQSTRSGITTLLMLAVLAAGAQAAGKSSSAAGPSAGRAFKCWTNKDGVKECGNIVPPEYSQQEHEQVSGSGAKVTKTGKAKTEEELEAERQAAEQKKVAEEEARKRAALDKVLLDTYSSEDDLKLSRDGQLTNIDSQIKLTEAHIDKLANQQDQLIQQAADAERRGQQVPAKLAANIDDLRKQIEENKQFIKAKDEEKDRLRTKFDADIKRFRELRGKP